VFMTCHLSACSLVTGSDSTVLVCILCLYLLSVGSV
jgi:hypothetical protein